MQLQIKMTILEAEYDELERNYLTFTTLDNEKVTVRIHDDDSSEDVEINVPKSDLVKALTLLVS